MTLNIAQEIEREKSDYEDMILTKIEDDKPDNEAWYLNANGTCWALSKSYGVTPKVGDTVRLYPGGFGCKINGQDLNGEPVYFKTETEMDAEHAQWRADYQRKQAAEFEEKRAELDAAYDSLPAPFKARLDRFRAKDPAFRYESEGYESFILVEAAKIAEHIPDADRIAELVKEGHQAQREAEKGFLGDGHSGNTHGCAWAFAERLLRGDDV